MAMPASGFLQIFDSYIGNVPNGFYDDEPCFTETIDIFFDPIVGMQEVRVNPTGVANDGDPDTFLSCHDQGQQTIGCIAGFPDGTVATCFDGFGPHVLPEDGDEVFLLIDPNDDSFCDVVVQRKFGQDNPNCRESAGTGGTSSGGGSSTCNASTASAVLSTGQSTTIASNACLQLKIDPSWSTVNPYLQPMSGTTSYPVPFSYSSCVRDGTGTLAGDWVNVYLVDGPDAAPNFGCDVFVKLGGNGQGVVNFSYFD